ncbi:MAG: P-loop NTPase, partial [Chitinophagaceae bacterium]|nr:P-loop NTPase [Chitinophagaceae bacterium]
TPPAGSATDRYYIFGKDGGRRLASEYDIPFLGQIPLIQQIREGGDEGIPVMAGENEASKAAFADFAGTTARSIAMRNANLAATMVVEVIE